MCVAAFALCAPAWAQIHKCVDARGKVSYQEQPCPGTVQRAAPPAPAVAPGAAPAAAAPGEIAPPMPDQAAKDCAERWSSAKSTPLHAGDFLRICARFGFVPPDSAQQQGINDAVAGRILARFKSDYDRRMAWEAAARADARARETSEPRHECGRVYVEIAKMRSLLARVPGEQQEAARREIENAEREARRNCP